MLDRIPVEKTSAVVLDGQKAPASSINDCARLYATKREVIQDVTFEVALQVHLQGPVQC